MIRTAILTLALAGLAACAGSKDETEQPAKLVAIDDGLSVKKVWSQNVGDDAENLRLALMPATDGSRVYAASHDGVVAAYDANSGKRAWRIETELPLSAGPSYGEGLLVLGSSDGVLLALDANKGEERWRVQLGSEVLSRAAVARDVLALRMVDGALLGLSTENGSELWSMRHEVPNLSLRGTSSPAITGSRVIAAFDDGQIAAVGLRDGQVLWELPIAAQRGRTVLERLADIDADVRLIGNDVYVLGYQSRAAMLAVETGQIRWTYEVSGYQAPGVGWNSVYITTDESEIVALDRNNGDLQWTQAALRLRRLTGPTPHGNAIAVGDFEGYVHWISNTDGRVIGRARAGGEAVSNAPLVVGETLFVQTDGGTLTAFRVSARGD